jgi:hypothetical protein
MNSGERECHRGKKEERKENMQLKVNARKKETWLQQFKALWSLGLCLYQNCIIFQCLWVPGSPVGLRRRGGVSC